MRRLSFSRGLASCGLAATLGAEPVCAIDLQIVSDDSWRSSAIAVAGWETTGFDDSAWSPARSPYPVVVSPQSLMPGTLASPIWHDPGGRSDGTSGPNVAFFRHAFSIDSESDLPVTAIASINADDDYRLFVNGQLAYENADGGNPDLVDQVDVSSYLRPGPNSFAVMASDGSLDSPHDRFNERLLFDARVQTVPTVTLLHDVPVSQTMLPPLVAGDVLKAQGRLGAAIQAVGGARIVATDQLLLTGMLEMSGGAVEVKTGRALQLGVAAGITGHGQVEGKVTSAAGSAIHVKEGNLRLGDSAQTNAVDLDGDIEVAKGRALKVNTADKASVGGKAQLSGGAIKVEEGRVLALEQGAQVVGNGGVGGMLTGRAGSAIKVLEGDLIIGDSAKVAAVVQEGDVEIDAGRQLIAESRTATTFGGQVSLVDGILRAEQGIALTRSSRLIGSGQIAGRVGGGRQDRTRTLHRCAPLHRRSVPGGDLSPGHGGRIRRQRADL